MGRPRVHASAAERQRAHREKTKLLMEQLAELREELTRAGERGRSVALMNHLPDDPTEWLPELTDRLRQKRLIACKLEQSQAAPPPPATAGEPESVATPRDSLIRQSADCGPVVVRIGTPWPTGERLPRLLVA